MNPPVLVPLIMSNGNKPLFLSASSAPTENAPFAPPPPVINAFAILFKESVKYTNEKMGVFYVALTLIQQLNAEVMQLKAYTCSCDPRLTKIRINYGFPVSKRGEVITNIPNTVFES